MARKTNKVKTLDEWNRDLKDIDDEDDNDLSERVSRGAKGSSSLLSNLQARASEQSLASPPPPEEVHKLQNDLQKSIGSLSLEEAKEAVKQAEEQMKLMSLNPVQAAAETNKKTRQKQNTTQTNKPKQVTSKYDSKTKPTSSSNSELEKIQKEMKEMMEALEKVTNAAASAREQANMKAKEVAMMKQEVEAAQQASEKEKANMEKSFEMMSASLQQEALANKDSILEEINKQIDQNLGGVDVTPLLKKEISIKVRYRTLEDYGSTGKLTASYQFTELDPANQIEGELNNKTNIAVEGDYIAAYVLPVCASSNSEFIKPLDIANYLDFNYIDESTSGWQKEGVVELTIPKKQRKLSLLLCYISQEVCLSSSVLDFKSPKPPSPVARALEQETLCRSTGLPESEVITIEMDSYQAQQVVVEDLSSIKCMKLQVPIQENEIKALNKEVLKLNDLLKDQPHQLLEGLNLGFRCDESLMSLVYPVKTRSLSSQREGTLSSQEISEDKGKLIQVHTSDKNKFSVSSITLSLHKDMLLVRLPYETVTRSQGTKSMAPRSINSASPIDSSHVTLSELAKHEARIEARKQARIARSKEARRQFYEATGQSASISMNKAVPNVEVKEDEVDKLPDLGDFRCTFCDATIIETGTITKFSPAPVGLLDNICDDLMCSACPVIDLSCEGVMPSEKQCLYSNQSLLLLPSAIRKQSLYLGETYASGEQVQCSRCLVVVGEVIRDQVGIMVNRSADGTSASDLVAEKQKPLGFRIYRHRVRCELRDTFCSPLHRPETFVSAFLIGAARKSNVFHAVISRRMGSSSLSTLPHVVKRIHVNVLSWTSLFLSINPTSEDCLNGDNILNLTPKLRPVAKLCYFTSSELTTEIIHNNNDRDYSELLLEHDEFDQVLQVLMVNARYYEHAVPPSSAMDKSKKQMFSFLSLADDFE